MTRVDTVSTFGALKKWVQPHMEKELRQMPPYLRLHWLLGLGADQLVTVAWMEYWKGLNK